MANVVENRIQIKGDINDIQLLKEKYSTHHLCFKKGDKTGFLNPDTNVFNLRLKEKKGVPKGFIRFEEDDDTIFPDFSKIIEYPDHVKPYVKNVYVISDEFEMLDNLWKWRNDNWGVSYNCHGSDFVTEDTFQFTTSWRPVPKLVEKMSIDFPKLEFIYEYFEEFGNYFGTLYYKNGLRDVFIPKEESVEQFELMFKLRPRLKKYFDFVDGQYKEKDWDTIMSERLMVSEK